MRSSLSFALCVLGLAAVTPVAAWWCDGHMVVSQVAMNLMAQNNDDALLSRVNAAVKNFYQSGPWPMNPDAVQLACWADDVKHNLRTMGSWHYINLPYNPENIRLPDNLLGDNNIVVQMKNFYESLKSSPNKWEESFAVAWLIHQFGDIHQPLHATTLFDKTFPTGDVGGNLFKITVNGESTSLHKYWDSACGTLGFEFNRPLSQDHAANISSIAQQFIDTYGAGLSEAEKNVFEPQQMANESFNMAVRYAYSQNTLKPYDALSQEYQTTCAAVAARQITLGGYRLYHQLKFLMWRS